MTPQSITLLQEIQEQPALLTSILASAENVLEPLLQKLLKHNLTHVIGLAEGSSKHVLDMAIPFWEQWTGIPMKVFSPDELEQRVTVGLDGHIPSAGMRAMFDHALVLVVSQSGETASVLKMLDVLNHQIDNPCFQVMTLTNREGSTLANRFDCNIPIGAGEEKSIAATKTMTASLYWMLWLAFCVAKEKNTLPLEAHKAIEKALSSIPEAVDAVCQPKMVDTIQTFTHKLIEVNHFVLLSKGVMTQILPEVGLKLTETSSNIAYTDNTESFKHGPKVILSGVNDHHPNTVYVVPPQRQDAEALYKDIRYHFWPKTAEPLKDKPTYESDRVFFIRFDSDLIVPLHLMKGLAMENDRILTLPKSQGMLSSMMMVLTTFQVMSYHLAMLKGASPDNPMLDKAVVN
jgi:glucosamine--fructose-6-phosphate aminotransferase (isomerizing)